MRVNGTLVATLFLAWPFATAAKDGLTCKGDAFTAALLISCTKEQSGRQLFGCVGERFKAMDGKVTYVPAKTAEDLSRLDAAANWDDHADATLARLRAHPEYAAWRLHESLRLAQRSVNISTRVNWSHAEVAKVSIMLLSSLRTIESGIHPYFESALAQQAQAKPIDLPMKLTSDTASLRDDLRYIDNALSNYLTCIVDPAPRYSR